MKRWIESSVRVAVLCTAVLAAGCAPYVEPYRYIHLDDAPGLRQIAAHEPDLSGLYLAGAMPVRYQVQRAGYSVDLAVPEGSYLPAIELTVEPAGLRLLPAAGEVPPSPAFCGAWYPDPKLPQRLQFGWSPKCRSEEPAELAFTVTDASGARIGEESLRFRLDQNGWLVMADAL